MENLQPTHKLWYALMAQVTEAIRNNKALPYTYMGYEQFCQEWDYMKQFL